VPDPELSDRALRVGKSEPVRGERVGEEGGVHVETDLHLEAPLHPVCEVLGGEFVAGHRPVTRLGVDGVQVDPVGAGHQAEHRGEVGP